MSATQKISCRGFDPRHRLSRYLAGVQPDAVAAVHEWIGGRARTLVLVGPPRSGRTHLAEGAAIEVAAACRAAVPQDVDPPRVAYIRARAIADALDRAMAHRGGRARLLEVLRPSALVVDDVDAIDHMPASAALVADALIDVARSGGRWLVVTRAGVALGEPLRGVLLTGHVARAQAYDAEAIEEILRWRARGAAQCNVDYIARIASRAADITEAMALAREHWHKSLKQNGLCGGKKI